MAPQDVQCAADNHEGVELVDINSNAFPSLPSYYVNNKSDSVSDVGDLEESQIFSSKGKGKDRDTNKVRRDKKGNSRKFKDEGKASSSSSSTTKEQQAAENASDIDDNDTYQSPAHVADTKHLLTEDTRFEHRQYLQKQLRRLQKEACRHTCKAYVRTRCKVHGHLFCDLDDFLALRADHDPASGSFYRSIDNMFKDGESTETCANMVALPSEEEELGFTEYEKSIMKMVELIDKFFVALMLFCLFVTLFPKLEGLIFKGEQSH